MTYEFAVTEATRRTNVLDTTHHVVYADGHGADGYMVMSRKLSDIEQDRYALIDTIEPRVTLEEFVASHVANR